MPSERSPQSPSGQAEERRGVLNLSYQGTHTSYANLALLTSTPEEVVLNFGVNVTPPDAQLQVHVQIDSRVIMTYPSAKRLAITLGNVIQRYETRHGVIEVAPQPPTEPPSAPQQGH